MPTDLNNLKIAIVHDWLTTFGGGERVVQNFSELFPDAPIYTAVYDEKAQGNNFPTQKIVTSFMQRIPGVLKNYRKMLSLMPRAFEDFNFSGYDLVLSSSSSCAKGVLTPASALHVSYVHSPMRYAWDLYPEYLANAGRITRWGMHRQMPVIRQWDALSSNRVDRFIANSREVAARIRKVYRRDSVVLHPPIETDFFTPSDTDDPGEYYFILSRFIPYKRIDLAVEACNKLGRRLIIAGTGPQEAEIKKLAGPTIEFVGNLGDEEIRELYRGARAFLFPGFEDFGMTPLESQACGRPVIGFGKGGILDSTIPGHTGLFFDDQSVDALCDAIREFENREWDRKTIREHAESFSSVSFRRKLEGFIREALEEDPLKDIRIL